MKIRPMAAAFAAAALLVGAQPAASATPAVWQPAPHTNWMWMISDTMSPSSAELMGTGITAWNGDTAPADDPSMYDIDAIINPASVVSQLHAMGKKAVCYIEVGTAGNYYSTSDEGTATTYYAQYKAAGVLGRYLGGSPENFLNINAPATVAVTEAMIKTQCADKGFDGVETDLDETFDGNEGTTGFTITQANEQAYLTTLANYMHSLGLAWIAKNLDDTGVQSFVTAMAPLSQGIITEQCNQYGTCGLLGPYAASHKPVFNAEYSVSTGKFCAKDNATANFNGVKFNASLAGGRTPCR